MYCDELGLRLVRRHLWLLLPAIDHRAASAGKECAPPQQSLARPRRPHSRPRRQARARRRNASDRGSRMPNTRIPGACLTPSFLAAGLILGGIGTDTGGSIRGPAALCGIAGIKPTYGLVSRAGVAPAAYSLDHIGPMAWTAEDCALMLQALAGHDPRDPASAQHPLPDYTALLGRGIKGLKIGVIHHFHEVDHRVSEGTQRGIDTALATFRDLGAELREVQLSPLQDWAACGSLISITERAAAYEEWSRTRLGDFSERMRSRLILGALVSGVDYVQAVRRRRELRAELQQAMAGLNVVLTATQPAEAAKIEAVPKWDLFDNLALRCRSMSPAIPRSRSARASAPAAFRWWSSSSASR